MCGVYEICEVYRGYIVKLSNFMTIWNSNFHGVQTVELKDLEFEISIQFQI